MKLFPSRPLSYADKTTGRMVLWGVVHAGPPECAEKGKYGVYVEVVREQEWIESVTKRCNKDAHTKFHQLKTSSDK